MPQSGPRPPAADRDWEPGLGEFLGGDGVLLHVAIPRGTSGVGRPLEGVFTGPGCRKEEAWSLESVLQTTLGTLQLSCSHHGSQFRNIEGKNLGSIYLGHNPVNPLDVGPVNPMFSKPRTPRFAFFAPSSGVKAQGAPKEDEGLDRLFLLRSGRSRQNGHNDHWDVPSNSTNILPGRSPRGTEFGGSRDAIQPSKHNNIFPWKESQKIGAPNLEEVGVHERHIHTTQLHVTPGKEIHPSKRSKSPGSAKPGQGQLGSAERGAVKPSGVEERRSGLSSQNQVSFSHLPSTCS